MATKYKYTRAELHNLLWKKPTSQLAKELDIKASHIRKICRYYNIPLPSAAYWTKIAFGKKVFVEGLYKSEKYKNTVIDLREPFEDEREQYLAKLAARTKEIELQFPSAVRVNDRLLKTDPLVRRAREYLSNQKSNNWRGFDNYINTSIGILNITVTKKNVARALRVFDSLIKLLRLRGHEISVTDFRTTLIVHNQKYNIKLREKGNRVVVDPDSKYPSTDIKPNGKLSLKLDEPYNSTEWVDSAKILEEQLARIVAAFELRAEKDIAQAEQRAIDRARQEEARKIEAKELAIRQWENKKIDILVAHSKQWTEAQNLQVFISSIERKGNLTNEQLEWIAWSKQVAIQLNPLSEGFDNMINKYDFQNSDFYK